MKVRKIDNAGHCQACRVIRFSKRSHLLPKYLKVGKENIKYWNRKFKSGQRRMTQEIPV